MDNEKDKIGKSVKLKMKINLSTHYTFLPRPHK